MKAQNNSKQGDAQVQNIGPEASLGKSGREQGSSVEAEYIGQDQTQGSGSSRAQDWGSGGSRSGGERAQGGSGSSDIEVDYLDNDQSGGTLNNGDSGLVDE